eukprot:SAG22_NODE_13_length_33548_cov_57.167773_23_plen_325_part_00
MIAVKVNTTAVIQKYLYKKKKKKRGTDVGLAAGAAGAQLDRLPPAAAGGRGVGGGGMSSKKKKSSEKSEATAAARKARNGSGSGGGGGGGGDELTLAAGGGPAYLGSVQGTAHAGKLVGSLKNVKITKNMQIGGPHKFRTALLLENPSFQFPRPYTLPVQINVPSSAKVGDTLAAVDCHEATGPQDLPEPINTCDVVVTAEWVAEATKSAAAAEAATTEEERAAAEQGAKIPWSLPMTLLGGASVMLPVEFELRNAIDPKTLQPVPYPKTGKKCRIPFTQTGPARELPKPPPTVVPDSLSVRRRAFLHVHDDSSPGDGLFSSAL